MRTLIFNGFLGLVLTLSAAVTLRAADTPIADAPVTQSVTQKWADNVWASAMRRDADTLAQEFKAVPAQALETESGVRFRDSYALHLANSEKAREKRDEARDKSVKELRDHLAANDLPKALRSAVAVQTLSDDLETAFADADVMKIIDWAKLQIPKVEAELDWLQAQELLFYLRTLYEDTGHVQDYKSYREQLDDVNRRVSLLAQYAPHKLHELRAQRALRLGDKPLGPYKPNPGNDWRTRTDTVRSDMLKAALKTAATEHIESKGWKPLLKGGLEELRLLATTASLDETFPNLGDKERVGKWVAYLDKAAATLEAAKDEEVDSWTFSRMLDGLIQANKETVDLPTGVLFREFGEGATYTLDEFSEIIWPDKLPRFRQATEGAFVGVGIIIRANDTQQIMVVNPLEGTPAYYGGVKPNDIIAEVDGESTVGWSLNDAVDRITGERGTQVKLGLQRDGADGVVPVALKRDQIKLRSVYGWWKKNLSPDGTPEWDWFVDPVSRIAYVKLTQFTDDTYNDLRDAWRQISAKGKPGGLVLDLRYNPGGLLTSAVDISNLFVKDGLIVSGEDKDGHKAFADQRAQPKNALLDGVPTVVLINQGSASASEIVSGCLQAHGAAVIVGERSYGKGSVQTVHQVADKARLKLTTQYYRLPPNADQQANGEKGRLVHKRIGATIWGVDPDIKVKMTPQQIKDSLDLRQSADVIPQDADGKLKPGAGDRPDVLRLLTEGMDPQLETALLILQARAMADVAGDTQHARANP